MSLLVLVLIIAGPVFTSNYTPVLTSIVSPIFSSLVAFTAYKLPLKIKRVSLFLGTVPLSFTICCDAVFLAKISSI